MRIHEDRDNDNVIDAGERVTFANPPERRGLHRVRLPLAHQPFLQLNFKGVIYVDGSAGVSGVVRGQVTLASTGNILLADDLTYVTTPGSIPDCDQSGSVFADILGLLTPEFFVIEDNNVNLPFRAGTSGGTYDGFVNQYNESADETVHAAY